MPCIKVDWLKHWWSPELDELKQQCIQMPQTLGSLLAGLVPVTSNLIGFGAKCVMKLIVKMHASTRAQNSTITYTIARARKIVDGFWQLWR